MAIRRSGFAMRSTRKGKSAVRKSRLAANPATSSHKRRTIELWLLIIAALPSILLHVMFALNTGVEITPEVLAMPLAIFVAFLVLHIIGRFSAADADPAVLPVAYALTSIGLAFVNRLVPDTAIKQFIWMAVGAVLFIVTLLLTFKMEKFAHKSYIFMAIGIVLMLTPMLPIIGTEINGSRIWLSLGPFSFQPGELAKVFIVLGVASYLAENRELLSVFTMKAGPFNLPDAKTLLPLLVMWGLAMAIIVLEKDFGTALVFFFVFLVMLYVATGKKFYVISGCLLVVIGVAVLLPFLSHVQVRIDNWLDPFADPQGMGYQMVQSLYSMADGGLFGTGIGLGMCDVIPYVENDYIFSAISEETGLAGAACVLLLYLTLAIRGYLVAARAKTDFASFVAVGMTSMLVLQTFIIVGGICRIIPLTGITMPFVSQGGSSLVSSFIALAFIVRCGDEGTGTQAEIVSSLSKMDKNGVLGRFALGKRLTRALVVLSILYVILMAGLISIMFIHAQEYQEMPGNGHTIARLADIKRGTIATSDGVVLAQSTKDESNPSASYVREYPSGDLASQVVGYWSDRFGTSGIENSYNDVLVGDRGNDGVESLVDLITRKKSVGNDVVLTIDADIQRSAQDAIDGYSGACVVLDATSGDILAMASGPTYNAADFESVLEAAANDSSDTSLLNRAIQTRYAPGSTFKTVTLAAALENNVANEDTVYAAPGEMDIGGGKVRNYEGKDLGEITLAEAYAASSNTVFAQVGVQEGANALVTQADKFGFDKELDIGLPTLTSRMPGTDMLEWELAWAAIGQPVGEGEKNGPYATVLEMALVGAGIANDGTVMAPNIVSGAYAQNGTRSLDTPEYVLSRACSAETAHRVKNMMANVVNSGTGTAAAISETQVYGKTGTAETGRESDDSWFVGFIEKDGRKIVVAMILEEAYAHGDGQNAASHCAGVFKTAYNEI